MSVAYDSRAAAGKATTADGYVYEGEWRDDKQNGKGEEGERESTRAVEDEG